MMVNNDRALSSCNLTKTFHLIKAIFVDVIHTDKTHYGAPRATGTADFWPNGGENQPGCPPGSWNILEDSSELLTN